MACLALIVLVTMPAGAQEKLEGSVSADFISHYVWRGQDKGRFSIQPAATLSWQGLSIGMYGSTGFSADDEHEIDLSLGFQRWGINIGVTDYWETGIDKNNRYLFFDEMKGAHQLEANIGYTCKYFSLQAYTVFWGKDLKIDGSRAYSTYIELGVPVTLGGVDWLAKCGVTPMESAGTSTPLGEEGIASLLTTSSYYYAEGFACLEASLRATKTLDMGFSKVPVFAELNINPYLRTANMIFGLTFAPF